MGVMWVIGGYYPPILQRRPIVKQISCSRLEPLYAGWRLRDPRILGLAIFRLAAGASDAVSQRANVLLFAAGGGSLGTFLRSEIDAVNHKKPGGYKNGFSRIACEPCEPGDELDGAWPYEQLVRMDARFVSAVERAIEAGRERRAAAQTSARGGYARSGTPSRYG
jgi:hypothetical protein